MRKLTIRRKNSFAAFTARLRIYIEDPYYVDRVIDGVHCRKLGELKSGEEAVFEIPERASRLFAVTGKLNGKHSVETLALKTGGEDICFSGATVFKPFAVDPFRFERAEDAPPAEEDHAVDDEEKEKTEEKPAKPGKNKSALITAAVIAAAVAVGFSVGGLLIPALISTKAPEEETFTENGVSITLNDSFSRGSRDDIGDDVTVYESKNAAVYIFSEKFSDDRTLKNYTIQQYIDASIESNSIEGAEKGTSGGLSYYTYPAKSGGGDYVFTVYVYKTVSGFRVVQFLFPENDGVGTPEKIAEWAGSVTFDD